MIIFLESIKKEFLMIKGIIFDFDGTLIDTMFHFQKIAGRLINKYYDIDVKEGERLYFETSGLPFVQQMEMIKPSGAKNAEIVERFEKEKLEDIMDEKFEEDVLDTFRTLKEKGFYLGISSGNYTPVIQEFLEKEPVELDAVMGFEEGFEKGKDHFLKFMQVTNIQKDELLFIGDSLKDGERAKDFGINFIGKEGIFKEERFKKEFGAKQVVIKKISDVLSYLSIN